MSQSNCPSLYQIDTRLWTSNLSEKIGGQDTPDEIPNIETDKFCLSGFRWIWRTNILQRGSDLREMDEPARFAISCYRVDDQFGCDTALCRQANLNDLKTTQRNYLIPTADAVKIFSCS